MAFEFKRNPRVLAGEILEKLGAVDMTHYDGSVGPTAYLLTIYGAIRGALEQIKFGKIPAMHVGMLDVTKELADAFEAFKLRVKPISLNFTAWRSTPRRKKRLKSLHNGKEPKTCMTLPAEPWRLVQIFYR